MTSKLTTYLTRLKEIGDSATNPDAEWGSNVSPSTPKVYGARSPYICDDIQQATKDGKFIKTARYEWDTLLAMNLKMAEALEGYLKTSYKLRAEATLSEIEKMIEGKG